MRAAGGLLLWASAASAVCTAYAAPSGSYRESLETARNLVERAQYGDSKAAEQALLLLEELGGAALEPVIEDLDANPPSLADADTRLLTLSQAAAHPAAEVRPGDGADAVKSILSDPRYQETGPSIFDEIRDWILQQISRLLSFAIGPGGSVIGLMIEILVAAALLAGLTYVVLRVVRGNRSRDPAAGEAPAPRDREAADHFADADRLAASADYEAALIALTRGVTVVLGGEATWDASPLTVRELFARRLVLDRLRPLVLPFEAAEYGRRAPDRDVYRDAAAAAAEFRTRNAA